MRKFARCALFAGAALGATAVWAQQAPPAPQVTAVAVAPGISVLFGLGGNVGVSHGEDGTLLIDDQVAAMSGQIAGAVEGLGAEPARFVLNTHWHWDHAQGNEYFGNAGALIIAHDNVRPRLIEGGTVLGVDSPPAPKVALPVVTYAEGLKLHLNGDEIEVIYVGGGHTDGDSIVRWKDANVLHMGDLFMHNLGWPFIDVESDGNVITLLATLERVIGMTDDETIIIPGHGELATREDLIAFRAMVQAGVGSIGALKDGGMSLEQAIAAKPVEGMRNVPGGYIEDDAFVTAVWSSLEARGL